MSPKAKAVTIVPLLIMLLFSTFGSLAYAFISLSGLPHRIVIPLSLRMFGGLLLILAAGFNIWIFMHRRPTDIMVSTFLMIRRAFKRETPVDAAQRNEPLILSGPQRHVRHPMYFLVLVYLTAFWLILDHTFLAAMIPLLVLWFNLVIMPFEERELRELFGEEYIRYERAVPKIIPSVKRKWSQ